MSDIDEKLVDLGVSALSQNQLEAQIENDAQNLINKQMLSNEESRLERTQNALFKCDTKKRILERRLAKTNRISIKQKLKNEIEELLSGERKQILDDIQDIKNRIADLKGAGNGFKIAGQDGRMEGESERDFLLRTGKITAFGSTNKFIMDERPTNILKNIDIKEPIQQELIPSSEEEHILESVIKKENSDESIEYIPSEDEVASEQDKLESEEIREELEEDWDNTVKKTKASNAIDDGDELQYRARLRNWIETRSASRKIDPNPEFEEHLKPHPDFADAHLDGGFKIPGEIFSKLFAYQKTCVQWLWELYQQDVGGIIGDEMGLGKTIQVIAFLAALHHSDMLDGPVLIVCPATVMKQWCSELHKWWGVFRTVILHSIGSGLHNSKTNMTEEEIEKIMLTVKNEDITYEDFQNSSKFKANFENAKTVEELVNNVVKNGHVLITTYAGLKLHSDILLKVRWSNCILDEGHMIRNPDSGISLACKRINTRHRIILSGTPIQNNLIELWSLFDFIYPGKLGTLPVFQSQFVAHINAGGYANATNIQVQTGYKCAVALRNMISPYLLRRLKTDVAKDLPRKNEMVLFCKLTKFQRSKYLEFLNSKELEQIQRGKRQVLYGIDILRKICNHPDILEGPKMKGYGDAKRSGKMQIVKQLLKLWKKEGRKTLLFTQSRMMLNILEKYLQDELEGISYLRMDGTTSIGSRQKLVDEFNNTNSTDVFLLTTRVGGLGINLIAATRIIIFDPDWNPSTDMQARERAYRIGQTKEVSIYRLVMTGTIEEKIYHRQIFKQFLSNKVLTDAKEKRFFKMNELHDLFTLGGEDGHATEELEEEVRKKTQGVRKEDDDFDLVGGFDGVSKLEGYYNGKEESDKKKTDDDRLMEGMLGGVDIKSQEVMEKLHSQPSLDRVEREAEKNAEMALNELKKSKKRIRKHEINAPTWTGKFGITGRVKRKKNKNEVSSSFILAGLRNDNNNTDTMMMNGMNDDKHNKRLEDDKSKLLKIRDYLRSCENESATSMDITKAIKLEINNNRDIINLRALLKKIGYFDKDKRQWVLKDNLNIYE